MVSFKVDAEVKGSEDQEKYPIVAKVKGTGKDGRLSVQVSGESSAPISAKISGDNNNPIALAPIAVAPITVVPDLKLAAESVDINGLISSISKLAEGIKVSISNHNGQPVALAIGRIPVDLTISVYSPAQEQVFKVEIKGTVGDVVPSITP
jgi:hypothetical protein